MDRLIEIEDVLIEKLTLDADVDGHDIGNGQMNIFIFTNDPLKTFSNIKNILMSWENVLSDMKAAYRNIEANNFTILWPKNLAEFHVT